MTVRVPWAVPARLMIALLALMLAASQGLAQDRPGPAAAAGNDLPDSILNTRLPALSPDGQTIAATWRGDIVLVPVGGGKARRLTRHQAHDSTPVFSPDGSQVAFASNRDHGYDIYTMPVGGGVPQRVTFDSGFDLPLDWTDEGIAAMSSRGGELTAWMVPVDGSTPRQLCQFSALDADVSPDGEYLAFSHTPGVADIFQMRYSGSGNYDIYIQRRADGLDAVPMPLTDSETNDFDPHFTADGQSIVYRSEEGGTFNVWRRPVDGSAGAEQLTDFENGEGVDDLYYSATHNLCVFTRNFRLWTFPLGEEGAEPTVLGIAINEDERDPPMIERLVTKGAQSTDAGTRSLVFELDGDIWALPAQGGVAERLITTPLEEHWPRVSPDGRRIAFYIQQGTNADIIVYDLATRGMARVTNHEAGDWFHSWSPDGQYLVFASDRTGDREIWTVNVSDPSDLRRLTSSEGPDDDPVFTPDGEHIVFDSGRNGRTQQDIMIMDRNGDNVRTLFATPGFDQVARVSPDGRWVVFESIGNGASADIHFGSIDGGTTMVLGQGRSPLFSPDGSQVIFHQVDGQGENATLVRVPTPEAVLVPEVIPMVAQIEKRQDEQFLQTFNEAWQALKNGFYDPEFHGVDWDAIRREYAPVAEQCGTAEELSNLINRAGGELGASHMGFRATSEYSRPTATTGRIGAAVRLVDKPDGQPAMRIHRILPGGPADGVWLREGDHILAVNNTPIANANYYRMLTGQQRVQLTVCSGDDFTNPRTVAVELIDDGRLGALRYRDWEGTCQQAVESGGEGRLGYIHLTGMNQENLRKLVRYLQGAGKDKEALVLDVRGNGGGFLHNELMDIFMRRPFAWFEPRGGDKTFQPQLTWTRPVVLLIDQRSFSDAEIFPAAFQSMGRGPVIGMPTPGGVIGTRNINLSDGSMLRIPRVGWFTIEGHSLEGRGVSPDIPVELTHEDRIAGNDPQLDVAIAEALKALDTADESGESSETPGEDPDVNPDGDSPGHGGEGN